MSAFEELGKQVAAALRQGPGAERRARQRARLIASTWPGGRGRWRLLWLAPIGAGAIAIALAMMSMRAGVRPAGSVEVDGDSALASARWLRVPDDRAMTVAFTDGTRIQMQPGSTSRLATGAERRARMILEGGVMKATVTPALVTGRTWAFDAGPYEVTVVGTELDVAWNAQRGRLTVHVDHGRVRVGGGALGSEEVFLGTGEGMEVEGDRIDIHRRPEPATVEPAPERAAPSEPHHRAAKRVVASAPDTSGAWEALARSGDYAGARRSAEQEGFDALVERLPAPQLELLADTARLAHRADPARARQALTAMRRRFPESGAAERAAFRLALLALASRDYAAAADWFERYLRAAPSGTFASDAAGRLIEARARMGDRSGAKAAATAYLGRFSDGPYADVARGVLRGETLAPE